MNSRQARIQEDTDFRIMRLLESQRELAKHLGLSLGGLNYCLKALMAKGFVKLENFHNSQHKLRYAYVLTPDGLAQKMMLTGRFLQRKLQEYEALQLEIEALTVEAVAKPAKQIDMNIIYTDKS